ncbi:hypothetical protein N9948_00425 [bacterium]|nr:hypothetical protein [bacterium]
MSDLVNRLDTLKKEIEETKSKSISLKASANKEEEILRDLVKEIKDLGFNPKTLKEDLEKMESDLEKKISDKEREVTEVKTILEDIERNVKSHEIS